MAKAPAFQFYPGDWRRDTQVQMATMETRGVWIELLVCMWFAPEKGIIEGEKEDICRMLGCDRETFDRSLDEIMRLKIADVTNGNNEVTIINRRMKREQKQRESTRLRVRKHRVTKGSNTKVTPPSTTTSPSSPTTKNKYTDSFLRFWDAYPKKIGKGAAYNSWKRIKDRPPIKLLLSIIGSQEKSEQWQKDNGQFIPNPSTWLNQRRWEDELSTSMIKSFKTPEQELEEKWQKT